MNDNSPFRDTIFALSSGSLPSGVAVIRLSGPQVGDAIVALAGAIPPPRRAVLRSLRNAQGERLDRGLLLFFPGPASFTGEDCAELHIHGSRAVASAIMSSLATLPELRPAEAGEFSRRAFINGKIDLTGAEGLADLINAETEAQRRLAIENAEGGQKALYDSWRLRLLHARALIEAELDFSDEDDVPEDLTSQLNVSMRDLGAEIETHIASFKTAEIIHDGFKVVLVGAPNAGKSSLLNALARREVAIVTDIPGTTRDLIEVSLDLHGIKVIVTDTAGIRNTDDEIEKIGVDKALRAADEADLLIELIEQSGKPTELSNNLTIKPDIRVATKSDLAQTTNSQFDHSISVVSGDGLDRLLDEISKRAHAAISTSADILPTRLRHVELLRSTCTHIMLACAEQEPELQAEQLRLASTALGKITGIIGVEELLGTIFSQFCIGK